MDYDLSSRLDQLVGQLTTPTVISGLEPLCPRLSRQFGRGENSVEVANLFRFCAGYIQIVPRQAETLGSAAQHLNLTVLIENYIELAIRYLESACNELEQTEAEDSLERFLILLQGAYIFNRMQEDLDDKIRAFVGVPFSSLDLMDANLIVHEVIGDNFGNRLDKVIDSLIQQSKITKSLIEANLDRQQIEQAKQQHSSLTGEPLKNFADDYGLSLISGLI